jgi:DNA-binding MarR family transcriptional regulator
MADDSRRVISRDPSPEATRWREVADVDRVLHEPARLVIVTILYTVESADFLYLLRETGLTKGNLSSHLARLESAGYITIEKTFRGKIPLTICRLTETGREAFRAYRSRLKQVVASMPE